MSRGLILCATRFEMALFLDQCTGLVRRKTPPGLILYSGALDHMPFDCMISGPGVFNTVHGLTVYLEQSRPNLILDTGIAGLFEIANNIGDNDTGLGDTGIGDTGIGDTGIGDTGIGDIGIGDIGIAVQEQYIHTGVGCNTPDFAPLPFDLIENQPLTRQGIYPVDSGLLDIYHKLLTRNIPAPVVRGNFITVSSITASPNQAQKIYHRFSCVMEAMEGAAALHVAGLYDVPVIEIRAASNFVGERNKDKWDFTLACERVGQICEVVIQNGFKTG